MSGPRARASRPSPPNVGVDRIRLVPYDVECALTWLALAPPDGALSLTVTPPCVVRCLAPLVSFARSTYHLTANVSYISFLL